MTLKQYILKHFRHGEIFTVSDLAASGKSRTSICTELSNMKKKSFVQKYEKGAYYIPATSTIFGILPPEQKQVISYICRKYDGYPTGHAAYNQMHLTEQVPTKVQIATTKKVSNSGMKHITFTKARISPKNKDITLLQTLDAITNIKKIHGKTPAESIERITLHIKSKSPVQKQLLVHYAIQYPPRTRYILSGILIESGETTLGKELKTTLNPTTRFNHAY